MILSLEKVKEGELKHILEENADLFDEEENNDAEFNILTL